MSSSSLRQTEHAREGSDLVLAPGLGRGRLQHPVSSQLPDDFVIALERLPVATLEIKALERLPRTLAAAVRRLGGVAHPLYPPAHQAVGGPAHLPSFRGVDCL